MPSSNFITPHLSSISLSPAILKVPLTSSGSFEKEMLCFTEPIFECVSWFLCTVFFGVAILPEELPLSSGLDALTPLLGGFLKTPVNWTPFHSPTIE